MANESSTGKLAQDLAQERYVTVMQAKVRVVLRIDPFLLCSAVHLFLAENRRLEVVVGDQDSDAPVGAVGAVAATPERTVEVVHREGWRSFEVNRADQKAYCQDLAALAGQLDTIACGT